MNAFISAALPLLAGLALASTASAQSSEDAEGQALLKKVSDSFSALPLESDLEAIKSKLTLPANVAANCANDDCSFPDANGTQHIFWTNGENAPLELLVKRAMAVDFKNKSIPALNIGIARSRAAVLKNVRAFLPEAKVACREPTQAGEGPGIASCGASLGEGWFKILFDADSQLIEARVDAYEFI